MEFAALLVVSLFGGVGLGLFFFGGLWWTVRRITTSPHPAILLCASYLVRTAVLLAGLYLLMGGAWQRMIAALLGVLIARAVSLRLWGLQLDAKRPLQ